MNFYRRYPQGYLLFFHITGKSVEISCYIKSPTGRDRTAAEGNHVASDRARRGNVPGHILLKLNSLKGGIYPSGTGSGKEGEYALVLGDSDHLCYGDSRIRIAVYHGGIFEKGENGSKLQRKAAGDFSAYGLTAKTKELCERKRNFDRRDILYENGMSVESL